MTSQLDELDMALGLSKAGSSGPGSTSASNNAKTSSDGSNSVKVFVFD